MNIQIYNLLMFKLLQQILANNFNCSAFGLKNLNFIQKIKIITLFQVFFFSYIFIFIFLKDDQINLLLKKNIQCFSKLQNYLNSNILKEYIQLEKNNIIHQVLRQVLVFICFSLNFLKERNIQVLDSIIDELIILIFNFFNISYEDNLLNQTSKQIKSNNLWTPIMRCLELYFQFKKIISSKVVQNQKQRIIYIQKKKIDSINILHQMIFLPNICKKTCQKMEKAQLKQYKYFLKELNISKKKNLSTNMKEKLKYYLNQQKMRKKIKKGRIKKEKTKMEKMKINNNNNSLLKMKNNNKINQLKMKKNKLFQKKKKEKKKKNRKKKIIKKILVNNNNLKEIKQMKIKKDRKKINQMKKNKINNKKQYNKNYQIKNNNNNKKKNKNKKKRKQQQQEKNIKNQNQKTMKIQIYNLPKLLN
ncbi:ubiquitin- hect domain protein, putative [Ichthyophthirius multifiliis]|uniref:Ubiquitin-hect domain protein, putative n=1 Tax=Ichthyophthirius multifiliis TaxID=5932 RepID=G0QSD0_ICHMU|nr:ubiquitin- hect domain protein, putative [Ichthyophthirius multifiliis]EGR31877.1 ubiquitin- hect domain protein, putative [Ichthyophthirius multifiliis]|eukprot:XP_004035363.1 ubiquitin- hect domain protein, putative [Ichthyophthirius multifiliis]